MDNKNLEFKNKLADLLEKYKVSIRANDDWWGYPECGQDIQIYFEFENPPYDEKFGSFISVEDLRK